MHIRTLFISAMFLVLIFFKHLMEFLVFSTCILASKVV